MLHIWCFMFPTCFSPNTVESLCLMPVSCVDYVFDDHDWLKMFPAGTKVDSLGQYGALMLSGQWCAQRESCLKRRPSSAHANDFCGEESLRALVLLCGSDSRAGGFLCFKFKVAFCQVQLSVHCQLLDQSCFSGRVKAWDPNSGQQETNIWPNSCCDARPSVTNTPDVRRFSVTVAEFSVFHRNKIYSTKQFHISRTRWQKVYKAMKTKGGKRSQPLRLK